ncbi:glycosyltransferase [Sediminispirochaeta bajacaliforniensis]|uniref:glycosyltransferase n=1 Tax=Sediminispirochaeta bajacaliforniensis TaxID=148 RepID=UPI00036A2A29|nr:glycosyltransferase [Sediminispirochaeta bajacaliforniensis]
MAKITVLSIYDRIACFHTLRPFLLYRDQKLFDYTNSVDFCLQRDRNRILVMVRWFLKPDRVDMEVMRRLRDKYDRIIFFHDDAGGGIPRAQVLPYVDRFYQKALFRDRSLYQRSLYGKELYSDYFHREHGVDDPDPITRAAVEDAEQLKKLRLSWNIGIGQFPKRKYRQRFAVAMARLVDLKLVRAFHSPVRRVAFSKLFSEERDIDVHARLGLVKQPSLAEHRRLILQKIEGDPRFLTGEVGQRQYNHELSRSRIVLSPFGWGELCFRDFEAVLSGAVLLKPDMNHLETWPDIFVAGETYIPFAWDAKDLLEKVDAMLTDDTFCRRIAQNSYTAYHDQLQRLDERFEIILQDIVSGEG